MGVFARHPGLPAGAGSGSKEGAGVPGRRTVWGNLACLVVASALAATAHAGWETAGDSDRAPLSWPQGAVGSNGSAGATKIEYWAGSGSNEAVLVIDFGSDSYAFGYRWDEGTKSGKDLLDAVDAAGALNYTEAGGLVATFSYGPYQNQGQGGWPNDWWSYFISDDGTKWLFSDVGFTARELASGAWDGWALQTTDAWPAAHVPAAPVPEPCTVALLGLGALFLRRRGR
jgi:hypothetical protein